MVDPLVGGFHLPQGFPLVPCLPAGLLPRRLAQTFPPRFLLEPIARWGLPTVRTVQPQPTLKLFHTSQQGINQRVFLVAGQLAKVGSLSHSQLESHFPLFGNPYNHTRCWGVTKHQSCPQYWYRAKGSTQPSGWVSIETRSASFLRISRLSSTQPSGWVRIETTY